MVYCTAHGVSMQVEVCMQTIIGGMVPPVSEILLPFQNLAKFPFQAWSMWTQSVEESHKYTQTQELTDELFTITACFSSSKGVFSSEIQQYKKTY